METLCILLALVSAAVFSVLAEKVRYDNYRVLSVKVANEEQRMFMQEFDETFHSARVLSERINGRAQIAVAPHKMADAVALFERNGMDSEVIHTDLQELIDDEQPMERSIRFSWTAYHNVDVIDEWLAEKVKQHPQALQHVIVGKSFENRTIHGVKLAHKKDNPTILIDAGIHAREWIAPATATYFLNELLTSNDPTIVDLAKSINWIVVPVINVDGYSYSHTKDRLWRKTRQPHGFKCIGADPNRNFDVHWASVGVSRNPCSNTYPGPRAFSEPETLAMSKYMKSIRNLRMYLTFHSYGQYLIFPPGYRGPTVRNYKDLMQVGKQGQEAIQKKHGSSYTVGPIASTLSAAAGGSDDWAFFNTNASLTYCVELRDRGRHGFNLPPSEIIPTGEEITDGIVAMVTEARKLKYL